jgi:hypothetical protein
MFRLTNYSNYYYIGIDYILHTVLSTTIDFANDLDLVRYFQKTHTIIFKDRLAHI